MNRRTLRHASVFSGIGGPEVAAAMLGWDNVFHCEINSFCREVLGYWFPASISYEDITKTDFTEWKGKIDVLSGGFPCQPFSLAGRRGGAEDDRYLWPQMFRVIQEVRPTWVVGENVAGIASMVQPGEVVRVESQASLFGTYNEDVETLRAEFVIETVCRDLERAGYSVQPVVIPACAVGAPHRRDRVFFLAHVTNAGSGRLEGGGDSARKEKNAPVGADFLGTPQRFGKIWHAANAKGLQTAIQQRCNAPQKREGTGRPAFQYSDNAWDEGTWWDSFPTVSPVCNRDDGLPFDVADLSIPYTRWRQEAIKACGNAIVPQVMYRIFQAIEQTEHETH